MDESATSRLTQPVRTMQIIVGAMTMGCATFLAVACFLRLGQPPSPGVLTWVVCGFVVLIVAARLVVPGIITRSALARLSSHDAAATDAEAQTGPLLGIYQTRLLISAALVEGPAFLCIICYLVEGSPIALGLAVLLTLGVAAHLPTVSAVRHWLEDQQSQHRSMWR